MNRVRIAAYLYVAASAAVVIFQLALAAGAPWGAYAMGGAFPGRFSPGLRVAAVVQAGLIVMMAGVVTSRSGLGLTGWSRASRVLVWVVVAVAAVSALLNLLTPSAAERRVWAPVALLLLVSSVVVAIDGTERRSVSYK